MENYPPYDVTPQPAVAPVDPVNGDSRGLSRARKIATGAAICVAVLATGGVAMAATQSGSPATQGGPGAGGPGGPGGRFGGPGFGGPRFGGGFGGPGGFTRVLHGTFVVPATSGTGTTTDDLQTGKVTAVGATSIALTSTDKVAGTYVVTTTTKVNRGASKIGDVTVGDAVSVIATDTGKKAISVEDRSGWPAGIGMGRGFGMPPGTPPSGAPTTPGGTGS